MGQFLDSIASCELKKRAEAVGTSLKSDKTINANNQELAFAA